MTLARFKSKDDSKGVRVPIDKAKGCYLYIRRISNQDYQQALNALMAEHAPREADKDGDDKYDVTKGDADPLSRMLQALVNAVPLEERMALVAEYVLVGWENLTDDFDDFPEHREEGSNRIRYTKEAAFALMKHPRYRTFYDTVVQIANDEAIFREQQMERDLGNSEDAYAGGSKTGSE